MGVSIWQILILLGGFFIVALPCITALLSKKARGWSKLVWFLLSITLSWIGYLGYYFIAVRKPGDSRELGRIHMSENR